MKKFLAVLLIAAMMIPCFVSAESAIDAATVVDFDRKSPVTDWVGEWVLVGAYIGEDFAEEAELDAKGVIAVPENAVTMTVEALLDASATGSDAGVMVDQAAYIHAHVYDMKATVKYAADISEEESVLTLPWDGWLFEVRGENEGDFNMGVGKLSKVSGESSSLWFTKVTGIDCEDIDDEKMKYVGMNTAGYLIVCYSEDNLVKKDEDAAFAYIFARVAE